jgi:hypothetical protein
MIIKHVMQLPHGSLKFHPRVNLRNACVDSSTLNEIRNGKMGLIVVVFSVVCYLMLLGFALG